MPLDPIEGEYKEPQLRHKQAKSEKASKKVVCPNCSNEVTSSDINIEDKIAKCGSCNQVFSFQHVIDSLLPRPQSSSKSKPVVGNQKDIDIYNYAGELSISFRDINDWWALIAMFVGAIFIFATFIIGIDGGSILFPLSIGLPTFLYSIYRLIRYRENKIHIDVDDTYMTIHPSQKYLQRKKILLTSDIKQVYTKMYPGSTSWCYVYIVHDGPEGEEHIKVKTIFKSRSAALYVEQELESYLGIPDEPVTEETKFD